MPLPYKIFTIYAREDASHLSELLGQLRPLEIGKQVEVWSDREINPGVVWEKEIVRNLDTADIILILVSSAYYKSSYIHEVEIKHAVTRHEKGEARVLPIIVRPCSFRDDPLVTSLQVLPTDGKPVTDRKYWPEPDEAWLDVVDGVKRTINNMREAEQYSERTALEIAERERQEDERRHQAEQRQREAQKQRIRDESARQEREKAENDAWQIAQVTTTLTSFQDYLAKYPNGLHSNEARAAIADLKTPEQVISHQYKSATLRQNNSTLTYAYHDFSTKSLLAAIAGAAATFFSGWVIWGMVLNTFFAANTSEAAKATMVVEPAIWAIFLANLAWSLLITLLYVRWANIATFVTGAKAGAWIFFLVALGTDLFMYASMRPWTLTATLVDPILNAVQGAIGGGVVGWVLGYGNRA